MANKTFDTIAGCVFLIVGVFFIVASTGISASSYGSKVGPNIFPTGLGTILVLLSVIVIAQARRAAPEAEKKQQRNYKRFALVLSSTFLYVLLFETLGYVISTFLYLLFVFQVMDRKRPLIAVLIAAVFAAAVYIVYVVVLQGTLPPFPEWLIGGERG
ncbi:MAG: tripartite tricarboxylate transporter TctB family protein [Deltaproteobacteria bacterium]|nr:tripartite tricarboxylate transporter TctB family protein [Deltaproteobacteria bacterium]